MLNTLTYVELAPRCSWTYFVQANKYKGRKLERAVLQLGEKKKISLHTMARKALFLPMF